MWGNIQQQPEAETYNTEVCLTKSARMTKLNIYRKRKQVCDDEKLKATTTFRSPD